MTTRQPARQDSPIAAALGSLLLEEPTLEPSPSRPRRQPAQGPQRLTPDIPCDRLVEYVSDSRAAAFDTPAPRSGEVRTKL